MTRNKIQTFCHLSFDICHFRFVGLGLECARRGGHELFNEHLLFYGE